MASFQSEAIFIALILLVASATARELCGQFNYPDVQDPQQQSNSAWYPIGAKIAPGGSPFVAQFTTNDTTEILCRGSIVADQVLLTSADCGEKLLDQGDAYVTAGAEQLAQQNYAKPYRIDGIKIHELYNRVDRKSYNIAVVKITDVFRWTLSKEYNKSLQPICLPTDDVHSGDRVYVASLGPIGKSQFDTSIHHPDFIQQVPLIVSATETQSFWTNNTDFRAACKLDGSGCFRINWEYNRKELMGILIDGSECFRQDYQSESAHYIAVKPHLPWILSAISTLMLPSRPIM